VPEDPDEQPLAPLEIEAATDRAVPLTKVSGALAANLSKMSDREQLAAIVKVAEPGYVPEGVRRRAAISPTLFTATLTRRQLAALESDHGVVSVELSRRLRPTD
jgi:hypothetical protein